MADYTIRTESFGEADVCVVELAGEARYGDLIQLLNRLDVLAESNPRMAVLIDETGLLPGLIGPPEIRRLARAWGEARHFRTARIAVFAPSPVIFGLNRMVAAFSGREAQLRVFSDKASATSWLAGLDGSTSNSQEVTLVE
jgi:hypothetical protein